VIQPKDVYEKLCFDFPQLTVSELETLSTHIHTFCASVCDGKTDKKRTQTHKQTHAANTHTHTQPPIRITPTFVRILTTECRRYAMKCRPRKPKSNTAHTHTHTHKQTPVNVSATTEEKHVTKDAHTLSHTHAQVQPLNNKDVAMFQAYSELCVCMFVHCFHKMILCTRSEAEQWLRAYNPSASHTFNKNSYSNDDSSVSDAIERLINNNNNNNNIEKDNKNNDTKNNDTNNNKNINSNTNNKKKQNTNNKNDKNNNNSNNNNNKNNNNAILKTDSNNATQAHTHTVGYKLSDISRHWSYDLFSAPGIWNKHSLSKTFLRMFHTISTTQQHTHPSLFSSQSFACIRDRVLFLLRYLYLSGLFHSHSHFLTLTFSLSLSLSLSHSLSLNLASIHCVFNIIIKNTNTIIRDHMLACPSSLPKLLPLSLRFILSLDDFSSKHKHKTTLSLSHTHPTHKAAITLVSSLCSVNSESTVVPVVWTFLYQHLQWFAITLEQYYSSQQQQQSQQLKQTVHYKRNIRER